jgi:hypothetical protein
MSPCASSAPNAGRWQTTSGAAGNREIQPGQARTSPGDRGRFERLMNEKSATDEDSDDPVADTADASSSSSPDSAGGIIGSASGLLSGFPAAHPALSPSGGLGGLGAAGAASGGAASGGVAACAAAQSAMNAAEAAPGIGPPPDETFEVSVQEPLGIAVGVQATRSQAAGAGDAKPAWTLTISSPVVDASVLARHVHRLNERLQARGATHSHIRIEEATEQSDERDDSSD